MAPRRHRPGNVLVLVTLAATALLGAGATVVGLDAKTHKRVFRMKQAGYTPMVSDGKRLYLVGYFVLVGLLSRS